VREVVAPAADQEGAAKVKEAQGAKVKEAQGTEPGTLRLEGLRGGPEAAGGAGRDVREADG
jgi:hypothetical protein